MLIIFDLDDTLIDTSGCITPVQLQRAVQRLIEAGLELGNPSEALELLKRLDAYAPSAKSAIEEFIEIVGGSAEHLAIALKEVYENISLDFPVFAVVGALNTLLELKASHTLALVTIGKSQLQLGKMEKAGIDSSIFSKIVVIEERNKRSHYQAIVKELGVPESEVLVCGDRISIDLTPAKELGYKTVQICRGRGVNAGGAKQDVDFTIWQLGEMRKVIDSLLNV